MSLPIDLKYTKEHEWIRLDADGTATIGITDHAQSELGDIVFVEIETQGQTLDADQIFGTIEAVKTVSDLFLPVKGEILEINPALADAPELVNNEPYEGGWMIKLKPANAADLEALLDHEAYAQLIGI